MNTIQIYPQAQGDGHTEEDYSAWYRDAYAAGEKKGFSRGVLVTFWFFYRLLDGGKHEGPSGVITKA